MKIRFEMKVYTVTIKPNNSQIYQPVTRQNSFEMSFILKNICWVTYVEEFSEKAAFTLLHNMH